MKAMILAAGKGTRVRPLTYELPKPMIPVLGKPVMAFLIEHLRKHGVNEIMINVSHLHDKIEEYFRDGEQFGVQIGYSFEGYATENGNDAQPKSSRNNTARSALTTSSLPVWPFRFEGQLARSCS